MAELSLPPKAETALNRIQDTNLSPMEEALYKGWLHANKIESPDDPDDFVDYRGVYKATDGAVKPGGQLGRDLSEKNDKMTLERALQQRMMERMEELTQTKEDEANQLHKEERQDITHQQKMQVEGQKLKRAPVDLRMKEHDVTLKKHDLEAKGLDLKKTKMGLESQRLGNEGQEIGNKGKKLDLISSLMQPKQAAGSTQKKV